MPQCPGAHCSVISAQVNALCKSDGFTGNVVYVMYNNTYCYCNCSCVAVNTLVAVGPNSWRKMGDFQVGDTVLTQKSAGTWEPAEVRFSNGTGAGDGNPVPYAIFLALGNGARLIVTADHPFLLQSGKLQVACRLSPSDKLVGEQGESVDIISLGYGEYVGGIHNIATSTGSLGEPITDHLINTAGVVSGDYYAQLYLVEDDALTAPIIGMPDYMARYNISAQAYSRNTVLELAGDSGFLPHENFSPPRNAKSFLPPWMETAPAEKLRPLNDTVPLEIAEYLLHHFSHYYPDINCQIRWSDNTVNAYAWREGSQRYIALLGGLIRHYAVGIEGLALVVAHEIGHHYGGPPRYPSNPWATCEGQADYWGALVAMREVWWGEEALKKTRTGAEQLYQLFAFGLQSSLSDTEVANALAELAGCGHPPAECRRQTYLTTLTLDAKPGCAG